MLRKGWYKYGVVLLTVMLLVSGCGNTSQKGKENQTENSTQQSTQEMGTESIAEDGTEGTEIQSVISTEIPVPETEMPVPETEGDSQAPTESETVVEDNSNNSQQNTNNNSNNGNNTTNNNNNNSNNNTQTWEEWTSDMVFIEEYAQDDSQLPIVKEIVKKIIKNGMTELEKAKAIHDYLVMNVDYDASNYYAGTIPRESYTTEGALQTKYAVCSGYAKAFQALCKASGLECEYVTGTGNGGAHGWNQVKIDGSWYNVDVTWDDPIKLDGEAFDNHIHNRYDYFLVPDDVLYRDHKADNAKHVCTKSLHFEVLRMGIPWGIYRFVETQEQLEDAVNDMVKKNEAFLNIMVIESLIPRFEATSHVKAAMKKLQIVEDYRITGSSIYPSDAYGVYRTTVYLELENGKYSKFNLQSDEKGVKKELLRLVEENGPNGRYSMYVSKDLLGDDFSYFKEHINRWAFYEHNLVVNHHTSGSYSDTVVKVTFDVHERTKEDRFEERAYSIKELEGYIKEMIERNDSGMRAQLNYENIELEGKYSVDYEIEKILQEKFGEKYGLRIAAATTNAYDNCVVVYISRVDKTE